MHTSKKNTHMSLFLSFSSNSLFILKRAFVILTFVFRCVFFMLLKSLSILREGDTIRGNWNNIADLQDKPVLNTPSCFKDQQMSARGHNETPLKHFPKHPFGRLLWWAANNISPWPGSGGGAVQGGARYGEGSCKSRRGQCVRLQDGGYPWLSSLRPCPASSTTVNEIPSLTQLADTQWKDKETEREDLTVSLSSINLFLLPFTPFFQLFLSFWMISTPVLWPKPVIPCLVFPLWHYFPFFLSSITPSFFI